MDMDAQTSLTPAITLQERTGRLNPVFESWYDGRHIEKKNTILDGLDAYDRYARGRGSFDFLVGADFVFSQLGHRSKSCRKMSKAPERGIAMIGIV
jgi:hypothetical protein